MMISEEYMELLNHYTVHLKLIQHCMSTILGFKKKKNLIKKKKEGCLGGSVVEYLPLAQVMIPGSRD